MSTITIVAGKIRQFHTERPSLDQILEQAGRATANGVALTGVGPFRRVSGVKVPVVVGPMGCTCVLARDGQWCVHRSLYLVATAVVVPLKPAPSPIPLRPSRERRGWTRRSLWVVRQPIPFRQRPTV